MDLYDIDFNDDDCWHKEYPAPIIRKVSWWEHFILRIKWELRFYRTRLEKYLSSFKVKPIDR